MARPIRNTPILTGKDATEFIASAEDPTVDTEKQLAERLRIEESLRQLDEFILSLQ